MDDRKGPSLNTIATIAALCLSVGAVIYSAGIQSASIGENRRRIEAMESKNDRTAEAVARIDTRTAGIEAKLSILIPDRAMERH